MQVTRCEFAHSASRPVTGSDVERARHADTFERDRKPQHADDDSIKATDVLTVVFLMATAVLKWPILMLVAGASAIVSVVLKAREAIRAVRVLLKG